MSASSVPRVMIVGLGFMGSNHLKNLQTLEEKQLVKVVSLVDTDEKKLTNKTLPTFTSLEKAYKETVPDIVCVCTNTKTHALVLKEIHQLTSSDRKKLGIYCEKPLTSHAKDGYACIKQWKEVSFPVYFHCNFLFRMSPAFQQAANFVKQKKLEVENIQTLWQKDREKKGPPRPTEGVIIDEMTHGLDASLCFLKEVGCKTDSVTIFKVTKKPQSDFDRQIAPKEMQYSLYKDEPKKLDPIALATYEIKIGEIEVTGFSSFVHDPQKREMIIKCSKNTTICIKFDIDGGDQISISQGQEIENTVYPNVNKLLLGWEAFLHYYETSKRPFTIPTTEEMLIDVDLTEQLMEGEKLPIVLNQS